VEKFASGAAEGAAIAKADNSRVINARDDRNQRTIAKGIERRPCLGGEVGEWDHTAKRGPAPNRLAHLKISPILGRVRVELQFLEKPILPTRISDCTLARLWTGEDRYLDPAIIADPLNPPFFRESRSRKELSLALASAELSHAEASAGAASFSPAPSYSQSGG
jgi:hypothetical protein